MKKLIDCFFLFSYNSMERQKILNPLTGRMVYADGVVAKSIPKMKKSVGVLEGAVKRTLAKKPEPKKVYGWEDLPDDIKVKISGIVKKNISRKEMNEKLEEILKLTEKYIDEGDHDNLYDSMDWSDEIEKYDKLTDDELWNFLYKGGIEKEMINILNKKRFIKMADKERFRRINGKMTTKQLNNLQNDKGDNNEFKEYYKNEEIDLYLYWESVTDDLLVVVNLLDAGGDKMKLLRLYDGEIGTISPFEGNGIFYNVIDRDNRKDRQSLYGMPFVEWYNMFKGFVVDERTGTIKMRPHYYKGVRFYNKMINEAKSLYF